MNYRIVMHVKIMSIVFLHVTLCMDAAYHSDRFVIRPMSNDVIVMRQHAIGAMFYRHKLVQAAALGIAAVGTVWYAYAWMTSKGKESPVGGIQSVERAFVQQPQQSFIESIKERCTYKAGISIAEKIIYGAARYGATRALYEYAFHPFTLQWYIRKHASYTHVITLINEYAELAKVHSAFVSYYKQSLELVFQQLIEHAERVCGYMLYHSKQLSIDEERACVLRVEHIVESGHAMVSYLESVDLADEGIYDGCVEQVQQFVSVLSREVRYVKEVYGA